MAGKYLSLSLCLGPVNNFFLESGGGEEVIYFVTQILQRKRSRKRPFKKHGKRILQKTKDSMENEESGKMTSLSRRSSKTGPGHQDEENDTSCIEIKDWKTGGQAEKHLRCWYGGPGQNFQNS